MTWGLSSIACLLSGFASEALRRISASSSHSSARAVRTTMQLICFAGNRSIIFLALSMTAFGKIEGQVVMPAVGCCVLLFMIGRYA